METRESLVPRAPGNHRASKTHDRPPSGPTHNCATKTGRNLIPCKPNFSTAQVPVQRWWARASWGLRDKVRGMVGRRLTASWAHPTHCPSSDGGQGRVGDYAIRSGGWWAGTHSRAGPTLALRSSDGGRGRVGDYAIESGGWWAALAALELGPPYAAPARPAMVGEGELGITR